MLDSENNHDNFDVYSSQPLLKAFQVHYVESRSLEPKDLGKSSPSPVPLQVWALARVTMQRVSRRVFARMVMGVAAVTDES
jgi:hypothetical protein